MIQEENYILKILFLRKIIRSKFDLSKEQIFSKFGIGIVKYEVCPNLKKQKQFKIISTVPFNQDFKLNYQVENQNFSQQQIEISEIDFFSTQIEQIYEDGLLLSGGFQNGQKRLSIHQEDQQIQNFEMQFQRSLHRTCLNRNNIIYIISGIKQLNDKDADVEECEIFDMRTGHFKDIKSSQTPANTFGCAYNNNKVFMFGGDNRNNQKQLDMIQQYDNKKNE